MRSNTIKTINLKSVLESYDKFSKKKIEINKGSILVIGPCGSGKSTVISYLNDIDSKDNNINYIESKGLHSTNKEQNIKATIKYLYTLKNNKNIKGVILLFDEKFISKGSYFSYIFKLLYSLAYQCENLQKSLLILINKNKNSQQYELKREQYKILNICKFYQNLMPDDTMMRFFCVPKLEIDKALAIQWKLIRQSVFLTKFMENNLNIIQVVTPYDLGNQNQIIKKIETLKSIQNFDPSFPLVDKDHEHFIKDISKILKSLNAYINEHGFFAVKNNKNSKILYELAGEIHFNNLAISDFYKLYKAAKFYVTLDNTTQKKIVI